MEEVKLNESTIATNEVKTSKAVPDRFKCPIGLDIMTDPVIAPEGQNFDRKNILKHLETKKTNPLTNSALKENQLYPNRALREEIDEFLRDHPEHRPVEEPQTEETADDNKKIVSVNNDARDGNPPASGVSNLSAGSLIKSPPVIAIATGTMIGIPTEIVLLTFAKSIGAVTGVVGGLGAATMGGAAGYGAAKLMQRYGLCCYNTGSNNRDAAYEVTGANENSPLQQNSRPINR